MIALNQILTFNEGEQGRYIIPITWEPAQCCDRPVFIYTNVTRSQVPGVYFSVRIPGVAGERTFDDQRDGTFISENDTNIQIVIRYDKTVTGFKRNTLTNILINLEPTCDDPQGVPVSIKVPIQYIIPFKCNLKINRHIDGTGAGASLQGSVTGGEPPYSLQFQVVDMTESSGWRTIYAETVFEASTPIIINDEDSPSGRLGPGKYRLLAEYSINSEDLETTMTPCEVELLPSKKLEFEVFSPTKANACTDDCSFNVTASGGEDGNIRFNLISDSKPVDVYWTYTGNDEDISNIPAERTDVNLVPNQITAQNAGGNNGIHDLINVGAGWYKVTVVDKYNNVGVKTIQLTEPQLPNIEMTEITSPCAPGANNGRVEMNISGGGECDTGPYEPRWRINDQQDWEQYQTQLTEEEEENWATSGCEPLRRLSTGFNMPEPTITENADGSKDYVYEDLEPGLYSVSVRDCMGNEVGPVIFEIEDPPQLEAAVTETELACECESGKGTVKFEITSGRYPIEYKLTSEDGETVRDTIESELEEIDTPEEVELDLTPSRWDIEIKDNAFDSDPSCVGLVEESFIIKRVPDMTFEIRDQKNILCAPSDRPAGFCDGSVTVFHQPICPDEEMDFDLIEMPELNFLWSNGEAGTTNLVEGFYQNTVNGLCEGNYTVDITGRVDGCPNQLVGTLAEGSVEITSEGTPVGVSIVEFTNPTTHDSCDGTITLKASGGTPPYEVNVGSLPVCENGSTEPNITISGNNIYIEGISGDNTFVPSITDANGCLAVSSDTIEMEAPIELKIDDFDTTDSKTNCDDGKINIDGQSPSDNLTVVAVNIEDGSNLPSSPTINTAPRSGSGFDFDILFENVPPGIYRVTITDNLNSTTAEEVITVGEAQNNPCEIGSNNTAEITSGPELNSSESKIDISQPVTGTLDFTVNLDNSNNIDPTEICGDDFNICCKNFRVKLVESPALLEFQETFSSLALPTGYSANLVGQREINFILNENATPQSSITLSLNVQSFQGGAFENLNANLDYGQTYSDTIKLTITCLTPDGSREIGKGTSTGVPFETELPCGPVINPTASLTDSGSSVDLNVNWSLGPNSDVVTNASVTYSIGGGPATPTGGGPNPPLTTSIPKSNLTGEDIVVEIQTTCSNGKISEKVEVEVDSSCLAPFNVNARINPPSGTGPRETQEVLVTWESGTGNNFIVQYNTGSTWNNATIIDGPNETSSGRFEAILSFGLEVSETVDIRIQDVTGQCSSRGVFSESDDVVLEGCDGIEDLKKDGESYNGNKLNHNMSFRRGNTTSRNIKVVKGDDATCDNIPTGSNSPFEVSPERQNGDRNEFDVSLNPANTQYDPEYFGENISVIVESNCANSVTGNCEVETFQNCPQITGLAIRKEGDDNYRISWNGPESNLSTTGDLDISENNITSPFTVNIPSTAQKQNVNFKVTPSNPKGCPNDMSANVDFEVEGNPCTLPIDDIIVIDNKIVCTSVAGGQAPSGIIEFQFNHSSPPGFTYSYDVIIEPSLCDLSIKTMLIKEDMNTNSSEYKYTYTKNSSIRKIKIEELEPGTEYIITYRRYCKASKSPGIDGDLHNEYSENISNVKLNGNNPLNTPIPYYKSSLNAVTYMFFEVDKDRDFYTFLDPAGAIDKGSVYLNYEKNGECFYQRTIDVDCFGSGISKANDRLYATSENCKGQIFYKDGSTTGLAKSKLKDKFSDMHTSGTQIDDVWNGHSSNICDDNVLINSGLLTNRPYFSWGIHTSVYFLHLKNASGKTNVEITPEAITRYRNTADTKDWNYRYYNTSSPNPINTNWEPATNPVTKSANSNIFKAAQTGNEEGTGALGGPIRKNYKGDGTSTRDANYQKVTANHDRFDFGEFTGKILILMETCATTSGGNVMVYQSGTPGRDVSKTDTSTGCQDIFV